MKTPASQLLNNKGRKIYSVSPETMVYDAIKLMNEAKVGALLVIEDNKLVGIISERDYARRVILENKSSHETPVKDIMTPDVLTVTPDQSVEDCMKLMAEHHIRGRRKWRGNRCNIHDGCGEKYYFRKRICH